MSLQVSDISRLRPFGITFEKSLHALISGIRGAKDPQGREVYLRNALAECREEVRSPDMDIKTMAVLKLAYLEMYGYDMSWASFHVLEVMSSPKFQQKRVGYLAAIQSFRADTDVLMLTTNLLKKDLSSSKPLEVSAALGGIASIVSPSLAQDLCHDIIKMLSHSKPSIRKRAVFALYNVILQYPEAFKLSFPRLRERLNDPDSSVVSATVNVICELAEHSPAKTFLTLAPQLYELLTTSKNNWMLMKILKLFASLAPREPRLKSKILPYIVQLMESTTAMSMLYECVNCIISGGMLESDDHNLASTCVVKIRMFLEGSDQNLRYVGLLALSKVAQLHPKFISKQQDMIMACIDDADVTIREEVLKLLNFVVDDDNLYFIVNKLIEQLKAQEPIYGKTTSNANANYYDKIIRKVIDLCSLNTYELIPNFEWFIGILVDLIKLAPEDRDGDQTFSKDSVGHLIGEQLRNIAIRVQSSRKLVVETVVGLVISEPNSLISNIPSVLFGIVWLLGEFSSLLTHHTATIDALLDIDILLQSSDSSSLGNKTAINEKNGLASVCIQAIMKIYSSWAGNPNLGWGVARSDHVKEYTTKIIGYLQVYSLSPDFEVQERAVGFLELLKVADEAVNEHDQLATDPPLLLSIALPSLFNAYELNPVAKEAQRMISIPEGIDIDAPLSYYSDAESDDGNYDDEDDIFSETNYRSSDGSVVTEPTKSQEETEKQRVEREDRLKDDPFYLGSSRSHSPETISGANKTVNSTSSESISTTVKSALGGQDNSSAVRVPRKQKVVILKDETIAGDLQPSDIVHQDSKRSVSSSSKRKSALLRTQNRLRELNLSNDESKDSERAVVEADRLREELLRPKVAPVLAETVEVTHKKIKKKKKATANDGQEASKGEKSHKKKKAKASGSKPTPEPEGPTGSTGFNAEYLLK